MRNKIFHTHPYTLIVVSFIAGFALGALYIYLLLRY